MKQVIDVIYRPIQPDTDERDWANLTAEQFMKGYAESDAIYDAFFPENTEHPHQPTHPKSKGARHSAVRFK